MQSHPTNRNPYLDESLQELASSCHRAASHLETIAPDAPVPSTLQERLRLLLIASGTRLLPNEVWGTRPEAGRDPSDFRELLLAQHQQRLRENRYRTLALAADHYLGHNSHNWLRDATLDGRRLYDNALATEEGLLEALRAVELAGRKG